MKTKSWKILIVLAGAVLCACQETPGSVAVLEHPCPLGGAREGEATSEAASCPGDIEEEVPVTEDAAPAASESDTGEDIAAEAVLPPDTDGDGVEDGADNCPVSLNADQEDGDGDLAGDACDDDWDADGVANADDNCPTTFAALSLSGDFSEQNDGDADGYGAPCDCSDNDADFFPGAPDEPEIPGSDQNCDGVDGEAAGAVFVAAGAAGDGSSPATPTGDLAAGLLAAAENGRDVYVAEGSYDASGLEAVASVFGGFSADFSAHDPGEYPSVVGLSSSGLTLAAGSEGVQRSFSGFNVESFLSHSGEDTVVAVSGSWRLAAVSVSGDAAASSETLVRAGNAVIEGEGVTLAGAAFSDSVLLEGDDSEAVFSDSVFRDSGASNATAVLWRGGTLDVASSLLDGGRRDSGSFEGIVLENAALSVTDSDFVSVGGDFQAALRCSGNAVASAARLSGDAFHLYSYDSADGSEGGYRFPVYVTCAGKNFITTIEELEGGARAELIASENFLNPSLDASDPVWGFDALFGGE